MQLTNWAGGYDVYRHHAVLRIIVAMTSINTAHVPNYSIVDEMETCTLCLQYVLATSEYDSILLIP
jgi:hypothetical protein